MVSRTLLGCLAALAAIQPPAPHAASRQPPVLTAFAINDGGATAPAGASLRLAHSVVGTAPSEYRVSPRADFAGAFWLPYRRQPELPSSAVPTTPGCDAGGSTRRLRLFLQVRASLGDEVRVVNGQRTLVPIMAESNVMADSICIAAPPAP